ncbi:MAG TPA: response regulator, partial [Streptosporangiaceae bacterium]
PTRSRHGSGTSRSTGVGAGKNRPGGTGARRKSSPSASQHDAAGRRKRGADTPRAEAASAPPHNAIGGNHDNPTSGPVFPGAGPPAAPDRAVPNSSHPGATARMAPVSSGPHHGLQGRKVLIIDDDVRNVFAITSILELYGITVTHAPNGRRGIDALVANDDIDLVLMDVMMPEMDGYTTTAAIRNVPRLAHLPVIAVTARAMPADRAKSLTTGATDYVTKPVDTEELLTCMERCLPGGHAPAAN